MKAMRGLLAALVLLLCAQGAWAQLYTRDSAFGANTLVVDTRTNTSWLQLSHSTGLTMAEIWASRDYNWTIQSGTFAGYRVALESEVSALIQSYVVCPDGPSSCGAFMWSDVVETDVGLANRALDLIELFGGQITTSSDGSRRGGFMEGLAISGQLPLWDTELWISSRPEGVFVGSDHFAGHTVTPTPT